VNVDDELVTYAQTTLIDGDILVIAGSSNDAERFAHLS
jgi:hypothetical protein